MGGSLWPAALVPESQVPIVRPVLLKLAGDRFMERLLALLANDTTARLPAIVDLQVPDVPADPPRLFHPGHGHYTIVMASLVSNLPGLPEHALGPQDSVAFVVRRLGSTGEYAWVPAPPSPDTPPAGSWHPVSDVLRVHACGSVDEELHPLFPVMWSDAGRMRRR